MTLKGGLNNDLIKDSNFFKFLTQICVCDSNFRYSNTIWNH